MNHQAGLDGGGGGSYIDTVICREKDANTAWTSASDGVLEERRYYCQNWRADVNAVLTSAGWMVEWDKYSSYGSPFGLPGGDADSSGNTDATDTTQIQTWINGSVYDVRGDINLNGVVNASDKPPGVPPCRGMACSDYPTRCTSTMPQPPGTPFNLACATMAPPCLIPPIPPPPPLADWNCRFY